MSNWSSCTSWSSSRSILVDVVKAVVVVAVAALVVVVS